jgi:dihydroxy-acid dehydratase
MTPSTQQMAIYESPPRTCQLTQATEWIFEVTKSLYTYRFTMSTPKGEGESPPHQDYDLKTPITSTAGLRQGLTSYGDAHFSLFLRKVFIKALGYSEDALSRPIIGIINTFSGFNPCHANVPQLIEAAKRGVHLNGGLAVEFPTISVHESFSHPTSMFLRNLMSMDTEEMIKAQPLDACIMIGGK